jgi:hypothetical protein
MVVRLLHLIELDQVTVAAQGSAWLCGDRAAFAIGAVFTVAAVVMLAGLAWLRLFGK